MDLTVREIDNYARGCDLAFRANMATMLWAAWNGAQFGAFAWSGKRLPNIDKRLQAIMDQQGGQKRRASDIAGVIDRMNLIALQAGLPPPKRRAAPPEG